MEGTAAVHTLFEAPPVPQGLIGETMRAFVHFTSIIHGTIFMTFAHVLAADLLSEASHAEASHAASVKHQDRHSCKDSSKDQGFAFNRLV